MTKTFKVLSALLSYPTGDLQTAAPELKAVLKEEGLAAGPALASLLRLIDEIGNGDLFDLQERYVLLFDRTKSLSLHLFEHIHAESRDRGQALVDLAWLYERHGLEVDAKELPDFLPLFLEFSSTLPLDEARTLLAETLHIVAALGKRLRKRQSSYASVFWALETIANAKPNAEGLKALSGEEDTDPNDFEALDKAWAEDPVTFGPVGEGGCSSGRVATRIRAALRPASKTSTFPEH